MVAHALDRFRMARDNAWQWRRELGWAKKLSLSTSCLISGYLLYFLQAFLVS